MSDKTLILHIGRHKTGTSSIQATLHGNESAFRKMGIAVPRSSVANHSITFAPLFFDYKKEFFFKGEYNLTTTEEIIKKAQQLKRRWKRAFISFKHSKCTHFVISAERLSYADEKTVEKLYQFVSPYFDRILIIVYYREAQAYLRSFLQERYKYTRQNFGDVEAQVEKATGFGKTLDAYIKYFGNENVQVLPFDRKVLKNGNVVDDFFHHIGFDDLSGINTEFEKQNTSLGKYSLAFLISLPEEKIEDQTRYRYLTPLYMELFSGLDEPRNDMTVPLSAAQVKKINAEYDKINACIEGGYRFPHIEGPVKGKNPISPMEIPAEYYAKLFARYNEVLVKQRQAVEQIKKHPVKELQTWLLNRLNKLGRI